MRITALEVRATLERVLPVGPAVVRLSLSEADEAVGENDAGELTAVLQVTRFGNSGDIYEQLEQDVVLVRASDRDASGRLVAYIEGWVTSVGVALAEHAEATITPESLAFPELLGDPMLDTTAAVSAQALDSHHLGALGTPTWATRLWRLAMKELGLGEHADVLRQYLAPSVRLRAYVPETPLAIGASRIGGVPDVGPGFDWPTFRGDPMTFIAQFDLTDIGIFDAGAALPGTGMLYFFYDAEQRAAGFDPKDRGACHVRHWDGEHALLAPASAPALLPEGARLPECGLELEHETTVPPRDSPHYIALVTSQTSKVEPRFDYFINAYGVALEPDVPVHRLCGHPDPVQGDMYTECQLVTNGIYCGDSTGYTDPRCTELGAGAQDWQLLLQIDSDDADEWMWGDGGRLYFWIRREDLIARRFDLAWVILQGH